MTPRRVPWFWVVFFATTAWKAIAAFKLTLCQDESYYHYWSLFPQFGYYDHPPLTAWAMALSGRLFGGSILTVRFWPLAAGIALVLLGRAFARKLYDERTAEGTGIGLAILPIFVGNGLVMTPDALLAVCWAASVVLLWQALEKPGAADWSSWVLAGVAVGVGLLAKYTMILFFLGLGVYWLAAPEDRGRLARRGWLCVVTALVVFSPVVFWNAQHDWVSFRFQVYHGLGGSLGLSSLRTLGEYIGALLLIASPVVGLLMFWSAGRALYLRERRGRFLASFFWAPVIFFAYSSLKARVEANWPMVALVSGTVILAHDWPGYSRRLRLAAGVFLLVPVTALMIYLLLPADLPLTFRGTSCDPRRMREFIVAPAIAREVSRMKLKTGADIVCTSSHQLFGMISYYDPELRDSLWLPSMGRVRFPWIDASRWEGKSALLVSTRPDDWRGRDGFQAAKELGSVAIPYKKYRTETLYFHRLNGYQSRDTR